MSKQTAFEVNFDGIVGPTHNYSGLSYGNVASKTHEGDESNPRAAALQGLEKMLLLHNMGIKQAVLPPHERPLFPMFKRVGFRGTDQEILAHVFRESPGLFYACCSASAMWTANAATVTPSSDSTTSPHVHFTAANLSSKFHRSIEAETTEKILKQIFADPLYFKHHPVLPPGAIFLDEGAANQTRFCPHYGAPGIHLLVFGKYGFRPNPIAPTIYPARQTFEAARSAGRQHGIDGKYIVYAQQNPKAIDAGVFHNDVISTGNCNFFLYHEFAFVGTDAIVTELKEKFAERYEQELICVKVHDKQIPLQEAVSTYLFNSQIITRPDGSMVLIAPLECRESPLVYKFLEELVANDQTPIAALHFVALKESMSNGGGPACLRLRVVLNEQEIAAAHPHVFFNEELYEKLKAWVRKHYRDRLTPKDLADKELVTESHEALEELSKILQLKSIYSFQENK